MAECYLYCNITTSRVFFRKLSNGQMFKSRISFKNNRLLFSLFSGNHDGDPTVGEILTLPLLLRKICIARAPYTSN